MLLWIWIIVWWISAISMAFPSMRWQHWKIFHKIILKKGISKSITNKLPITNNADEKRKNVMNALEDITKDVTWTNDIVSSAVDMNIIENSLTWLDLNYDPNKVVKLKDLKKELKDGFSTYQKLYDENSNYCKNLTDIVNNQIDGLSNLNDYYKAIVLFKYYSLSFIEEISINWTCGTIKNICTKGTLVDMVDNWTYYKWQCRGWYGWTTANCQLHKPVNGVCGTSINSCSAWTLTGQVDTTSAYNWKCQWQYNWTTVSCSKTKYVTTCNASNVGKKNAAGQTCHSVSWETRSCTTANIYSWTTPCYANQPNGPFCPTVIGTYPVCFTYYHTRWTF